MQDEEAQEDQPGKARRGRILRWTGGVAAVLVLVLLALWTQRQPIAENFVGRELARRDVHARYEIASIGFRTQRLENIVLGDPARPDLTAQWVEVDVAFAGVSPQVAAVRAGGVRMFGSFRNGVLRLGEIDKFRDPASTAPFSLPDLSLTLADARMRLETDAGPVGIKLDGGGNLRSGFRGKLAAMMPRADLGGCGLTGATAYVDIRMSAGRPRIAGPVRGDALGCPDSGVAIARPVLNADVTLSQALDRWTGQARLSAQAIRAPGALLARPSGRITFDGTKTQMRGQMRVGAEVVTSGQMLAGPTELTGAWTAGSSGQGLNATLDGDLSARNVRTTASDPLAGLRASSAGTPVAPLAAKLADAIRDAGRDNRLRARFAFAQRGQGGSAVLTSAQFFSASGARAGLGQGGRFTLAWPGNRWALDGGITMGGGGLPDAALRLAARPSGGYGGQLFVKDYAAGGARLSLEPVRFVAGPGGETRFTTRVGLNGPLDGGGLRGLTLPVEGVMSATGAIAINRRCTPLALASLSYGGFALGQTRLTLCPSNGRALFAAGPAGMSGGGVIRAPRLNGRLGQSPMRLSAASLSFALAQPGFALRDADLAIGPLDSPVRLTAALLEGVSTPQGLGGRLTGATGKIGAVPLSIGDASGKWGFAQGTLKVDGGLTLSDTQSPSRFEPLVSRDFVLTLRDNRVAATGTLLEPRSGATVVLADIVHDLGPGKGKADLSVPGISFTPTLQPEAITRLALGVVANARGTISGKGQIRWTGSTVTSDGLFRTDNMDLAAAFGPVTGLSGELRFTDLLGLVSAPGQVMRIASVNPGVEVTQGVVRYQLIPDQRVQIESGEWPFSGGRLFLLPTTLDFGADKARTLAFRVVGLDAGAFINTLQLDNISATGTFDGLLPMIFGPDGGRIVGGVLVARQIGLPPLILQDTARLQIPCDPARQAGTLAYVGPVSNEQLGVFGKLAFDALKNLQYKCLTILMDGAIDGEVVTQVSFNGVNRGQIGDAPAALARQFIGLPFIFNIRIEAPFRGLLNTAQSFVDPSGLIRNSLGDQYAPVIEKQGVAVQPAESDKTISGDRK